MGYAKIFYTWKFHMCANEVFPIYIHKRENDVHHINTSIPMYTYKKNYFVYVRACMDMHTDALTSVNLSATM